MTKDDASGVDVMTMDAGRRPVLVSGVKGDTRIAMSSGVSSKVLLRMPRSLAVAEFAPYKLTAELWWLDGSEAFDDPRSQKARGAVFDGNNEILVNDVPEGEYCVTLFLVNHAPGARWSARSLDVGWIGPPIRVRGDGSEVAVELVVDLDLLRRQVRSLR